MGAKVGARWGQVGAGGVAECGKGSSKEVWGLWPGPDDRALPASPLLSAWRLEPWAGAEHRARMRKVLGMGLRVLRALASRVKYLFS